MKEGWEVRPLGKVASIDYGTRIRRTDSEGDTYPVYGGGGETFRHGETNRKSQLVVSRFGMSEECVRYVEGPFFLNDSGLTVSTTSAPDLDQTFLDRFLHGSQPQIFELGTGSAQKNLKLPLFRQLPIPLPPLEEQRRIVAVLDEAFEGLARARANIEANLADAGELRTRAIATVFGELEEAAPSLLLKDVALDFGRGKSKHRPRNDLRLYGGDYPFIQTGDVRAADRYLRLHSQSYNETGLAQSKLWPEGTVCVTIAANIAETATLTYPACFPDSVIGIVPKDDAAIAEYIEYVLQYARVRLQARGRGAAQDNINLKTFETEYFPFPPIAEQESVVRQLDEVHDRVGQFVDEGQEQLADLATLRQSLLARAFQGELT